MTEMSDVRLNASGEKAVSLNKWSTWLQIAFGVAGVLASVGIIPLTTVTAVITGIGTIIAGITQKTTATKAIEVAYATPAPGKKNMPS